ncbi:hypothetical protein E2C01_081732 [Portunus trituberculatus]|uniref:Uncharacterized protein n=1 Tax=Portunus trituberculatus TaxID=210409 RepID=A0A5B7J343_PORTR|nr:hypothetical protein [Portunus trituberculatus]
MGSDDGGDGGGGGGGGEGSPMTPAVEWRPLSAQQEVQKSHSGVTNGLPSPPPPPPPRLPRKL